VIYYNILKVYKKIISWIKNWKKFLENKVNESSDQDRYEDSVFSRRRSWRSSKNISEGEDAALEYLKQCHDLGHHEGTDELGQGSIEPLLK